MGKFKIYDRSTPYLIPPSVEDWLPSGHLAYFVVDIVERLDLSEIKKCYSYSGSKAYAPEVLVGLLFYGYMSGVFSSRKIEAATYESLAFRLLAANQHPDHDTIANFRAKYLQQLEGVFLQILIIAREIGVKKIGKVSLDGTKIKANASKHKALSWAYANRLEEQLKEEVAQLISKGQEADSDNSSDGMKVPEEIAIRQKRLLAIESAKEKIKARAKERYDNQLKEYEEKIKSRAAKEQMTGKKAKGKEPTAPSAEPLAKDQVNLTDEESKIMPIAGGGFGQCYNAQACVDIDSMLIVTNHLTIRTNDKKEITPAIDNLGKLPKCIADIEDLLADTGYHSKENIQRVIASGINPLIAEKRDKHHPSPEQRFAEALPLAEGASASEMASWRLRTEEGKMLYAKRKSTIEPVFGIIKHIMGFRQFSLRGEGKVAGEWNLVSIAWNIKRLHKICDNLRKEANIEKKLLRIINVTLRFFSKPTNVGHNC
jgi:transposase